MTVSTRFRPNATGRTSIDRATRLQAILGGGSASLAAGLGMLLLRATMGVRTVPERFMEWLLLFVPPGAFEAMLQRFGLDAKRYALTSAILLMLVALSALGYVALRRSWSSALFAALGIGLWLVVMLGVMPLTAAGVFALDLLDGKRAAILGYLAIALTYAAVLGVARMTIAQRTGQHTPTAFPRMSRSSVLTPGQVGSSEMVERRTLVGLIGTAALAYLGTYAAVLLLPKSADVPSILILDPQEPVPSGGVDPPNAHPQAVSETANTTTATGAPTPNAPTVSSSPAAATDAFEPAASRQLGRDKDGAVLPAGYRTGKLVAPITSNLDFYIVTKNAGGDPEMHAQNWRLLVDGDVPRSFQLDYATLRKLSAVEVTKTLECISNFVAKPELAPFGANLISTATWKGVRVNDILQLTGGVKSDAEWLAVLSADEYTSALPIEAATDPDTLLVYEMNGEVLPREHGYPARLLVPNRYGMKNPKWVIGLRPMRREFVDWYGQRNWSKSGMVRTMCRIDEPLPGARLSAGSKMLAGIAYAGTRGIQRVEYSSDGGETWREAQILEPAAGRDSWVRWRGEFDIEPGAKIKLIARATDGGGEVQVEPFSLPEPDGGTGWPSVEVQTA